MGWTDDTERCFTPNPLTTSFPSIHLSTGLAPCHPLCAIRGRWSRDASSSKQIIYAVNEVSNDRFIFNEALLASCRPYSLLVSFLPPPLHRTPTSKIPTLHKTPALTQTSSPSLSPSPISSLSPIDLDTLPKSSSTPQTTRLLNATLYHDDLTCTLFHAIVKVEGRARSCVRGCRCRRRGSRA